MKGMKNEMSFARVGRVPLINKYPDAYAETIQDCAKLCDDVACHALAFYEDEHLCVVAESHEESQREELDWSRSDGLYYYVIYPKGVVPKNEVCYKDRASYSALVESIFPRPPTTPALKERSTTPPDTSTSGGTTTTSAGVNVTSAVIAQTNSSSSTFQTTGGTSSTSLKKPVGGDETIIGHQTSQKSDEAEKEGSTEEIPSTLTSTSTHTPTSDDGQVTSPVARPSPSPSPPSTSSSTHTTLVPLSSSFPDTLDKTSSTVHSISSSTSSARDTSTTSISSSGSMPASQESSPTTSPSHSSSSSTASGTTTAGSNSTSTAGKTSESPSTSSASSISTASGNSTTTMTINSSSRTAKTDTELRGHGCSFMVKGERRYLKGGETLEDLAVGALQKAGIDGSEAEAAKQMVKMNAQFGSLSGSIIAPECRLEISTWNGTNEVLYHNSSAKRPVEHVKSAECLCQGNDSTPTSTSPLSSTSTGTSESPTEPTTSASKESSDTTVESSTGSTVSGTEATTSGSTGTSDSGTTEQSSTLVTTEMSTSSGTSSTSSPAGPTTAGKIELNGKLLDVLVGIVNEGDGYNRILRVFPKVFIRSGCKINVEYKDGSGNIFTKEYDNQFPYEREVEIDHAGISRVLSTTGSCSPS